MLKPYKTKVYVSIDDGPKIDTYGRGYGLTEDDVPSVFSISYTFQEALNAKPLSPDICVGTTLFRKRPYIEVRYDWCDEKRYYNFDKITIERRKEPWRDATLKDVHDYSTADQFIQYLKEHGITTCPMNF